MNRELIKLSSDIIIKNGNVIDGAGNPWYRADIAIKDGKIAKIRPKLSGDAIKEIDASGLIACPGFIDMHSHTDFVLPLFNKADSFLRQGITTCVIGQCGNSFAPIRPDKEDDFRRFYTRFIPQYKDFKFQWNTFEQYLQALEKKGCPANLVPFVGYENIRIAGGPGHENRPPSPEEIEEMKKYAIEAMEAGALGLSTGLIYAPQVFAKTDEILEVAKVVGEYQGLYFSHIRGEGQTVVDAVEEVIEIVEKSGCVGGHISHHKIAGKIYWGTSKETLRLIEEANARGINISCDQYPYNRSMTKLSQLLPSWAHEGGDEMLLERLRNPDDRERMKKDVVEGIKGWGNFNGENGFDYIFIASARTKKWKDIEGKNISEITKIKGKKDEWETLLEILIDEELGAAMTIETMGEEDIRRIMTSRYQMVGTDGLGIPYLPQLGKFHPRFYGTYPRILGKYVREENVLTLEDAIRRMTSFPAQRLGLRDRGLLYEGTWADIVIFDPSTIIDKATYENPNQFPEGMLYVIVNGVIVVDNNKQKNKYPGVVLRRLN